MTSPSVTYAFNNGDTSDASQVNQNFTDIINAMTDGTKSFSIDALTVAGAGNFNGSNNIGNATSDVHTVTGRISGNGCVPAGAIQAFAMATPPTGWLLCDGSEVSQTTYAALFSAISTTWDTCYSPLTQAQYSSPTTGNFRVPDLRGTFLRGVGDFSDNTKDTTLAGFQADQYETHEHTFLLERGNTSVPNPTRPVGTNDVNSSAGSKTTESSTGRNGTETRPQNVGVHFMIKT